MGCLCTSEYGQKKPDSPPSVSGFPRAIGDRGGSAERKFPPARRTAPRFSRRLSRYTFTAAGRSAMAWRTSGLTTDIGNDPPSSRPVSCPTWTPERIRDRLDDPAE